MAPRSQSARNKITITNPDGGVVKAKLGMAISLKPIGSFPLDKYAEKHAAFLRETPEAEYSIQGLAYVDPPLLRLIVEVKGSRAETTLPASHCQYKRVRR